MYPIALKGRRNTPTSLFRYIEFTLIKNCQTDSKPQNYFGITPNHSSSVNTVTPRARAVFALLPASAPTMT